MKSIYDTTNVQLSQATLRYDGGIREPNKQIHSCTSGRYAASVFTRHRTYDIIHTLKKKKIITQIN